MKAMNHYGPQLAKIRRDLGIKAATVARHLGISDATYSQIETGQRSASLERVALICAELGISPVQLFELDDKMTCTHEEPTFSKVISKSVIYSLSKLDPEYLLNRKEVADFLHISLKTLYRRCKSGALIAVRVERNVRFRVQTVLEYINHFSVATV